MVSEVVSTAHCAWIGARYAVLLVQESPASPPPPKLRGIGWADTTRLWPKVPITARDKPPMNFGGDHSAPGWQDCALMHSQATGHGKISPRCVPEGAPDGKSATSWQYIAFMYSNTANFGKICAPCIQKAPQSAVGEYTARTSCRQGALSPSEALRSCTAHESCHPPVALPLRRGSCPSSRITGSPFNGLALAQGCPPQRLANTRHLPMPAACRAHCSQRQAADGLRRRSSGAWPAVRPSPEGPPTAPSRRAGRQRSAAQSWA